MPTSSCYEAALEYLRRGWSVVPVETWTWESAPSEEDPKGKPNKSPLVRWREYAKRLPTTDEVRQWWTRWPDAGVAIITGGISKLVVADFDGVSPTPDWPDTFTVKSPAGEHRYYTLAPGEIGKQGTNVYGEHVDSRGEGGYIIAAPTVRVDDGVYFVVDEREPTWRPAQMIRQSETLGPFERAVTEHQERWVGELLANGARHSSAKTNQLVGRNDALTRLTGYFAGKGIEEDVTMVMLGEWALTKCTPPMDLDEAATTIASTYQTARRRQVEEERQVNPEVKAVDETQPPVRFLSLTDFRAKYGGHEVEWLIDGWVPKATILFAVSPPECFKSWLVGEMAAAIATKRPMFSATEVVERGPVLYMQQEDHHGQTAGRLTVQVSAKQLPGHGMFELLPPGSDDIYVQEDRDFHFENKAAIARLEAKIEEVRPALVIIDPLYQAVSTDDYMVKAARQMRVLKLWRDRYGCSFILVHHAGKGNGLSFDRERAWGSQFLNAFVEGGFQIGRADERDMIVKRHFKMCQAGPLIGIVWNIDTTLDVPRYLPEVREVSKDELEEAQARAYAARNGARRSPFGEEEDETPKLRKRSKKAD